MGRFNWNFWVKRPHTSSFFQNNSALFRKKRELFWNTMFLSLEKPSFVRGFWHRVLSGVGHHSPLFYFLSFPFSQHSHFSLSPRHPLSPSSSQSLPRYHAANSSFPAFDTVLGADFVLVLGQFWECSGAARGNIGREFGADFGAGLVLIWGQKRRVHWIFSNALFHFPKVKINGQTAIFQGIVSECLEWNPWYSIAYWTCRRNTI